jgi:hypothetical protein
MSTLLTLRNMVDVIAIELITQICPLSDLAFSIFTRSSVLRGRHTGCDPEAKGPRTNRAHDVVVWTDLAGSFGGVPKESFLDTAVDHVQRLPPEGKAKAAEYVWRAPEFIVTPLRAALQAEPWFKNPKAVQSDSVKT